MFDRVCTYCGRGGYDYHKIDHRGCAENAGHASEPQEDYRVVRARLMGRLRAEGWTYARIGEYFNLSPERIRQILGASSRAARRAKVRSPAPPGLWSADVWAVSKHVGVLDAIADF